MVSIGLEKLDLQPALRPDLPVTEERVETAALYIRSESLEAVWMELDFMDFNLNVVNRLIEAVHTSTGIDPAHIHILTTHNHGGGTPDMDVLCELAGSCAESAMKKALPAKMRAAIVPVPRRINYIRRMFVPEMDASTSYFFGACEQNAFDSAPHTQFVLDELAKGRLQYSGSAPTTRSSAPFPEADPLLTAVEFAALDGTPIGSAVRFAAHAVCSNRSDAFSGDYPFNVRRGMEQKFGGTSIFFNGPCGDIAPAIAAKYDGSSLKLGELISDTAVSALEKLDFSPICEFSDLKVPVSLPVREEVLAEKVDIPDEMPESLSERIRWLEKKRSRDQMDFLLEKYKAGETSLSDTIEVNLGFLRLNDFLFAAFPGETFSGTGRALRKAFPDLNLTTFTEHCRTVMYIPTADELSRGGYETTCRVTGAGAAEKLLADAKAALAEFIG